MCIRRLCLLPSARGLVVVLSPLRLLDRNRMSGRRRRGLVVWLLLRLLLRRLLLLRILRLIVVTAGAGATIPG